MFLIWKFDFKSIFIDFCGWKKWLNVNLESLLVIVIGLVIVYGMELEDFVSYKWLVVDLWFFLISVFVFF